ARRRSPAPATAAGGRGSALADCRARTRCRAGAEADCRSRADRGARRAPAARTRRRRAFGSAPRSGGTRTRRPSSLRSRHTGRWPLLGCYLVRASAIEAVEVDVERLVASPPPAALVDAAHVVERPEPVEVPEQFPEHAIVALARKGRDPDQVAVAALEPAGLVVDEQDLPPVEAEPVELA